MRTPFVAGNWKMNGTRASARALIEGILGGLPRPKGVDICVCPPFVLLHEVSQRVKGSPIRLGGQDVSEYASGAYTGDIAADMLCDAGCQFVIVGHSERRNIHQESDQIVAKKMIAAKKAGLVPIVCVGESLAQRESNETTKVIAAQIDALLAQEGGRDALESSIIAYEPIWAIGTGRTATPEQAQEVHHFIRTRIAALDGRIAERLRILYGGSVKPENARDLFGMADIDGGLIGGASLNANDFVAICTAAQQA